MHLLVAFVNSLVDIAVWHGFFFQADYHTWGRFVEDIDMTEGEEVL